MYPARNYCTYFDSGYYSRGLCLIESLKKYSKDCQIWALCLDDKAYLSLSEQNLNNVFPVSISEFEEFFPELVQVKPTRSKVEYYFTLTPFLPQFVLDKDSGVEMVTYLDSDLYFYSSPEPLFSEIGNASIAVIPHNCKDTSRIKNHGKFNVGWNTFRRDETGLACLKRWRQQCIEWCYDYSENNKYADQKYLDEWPDLYRDVCIIKNSGANVAPWNIYRFPLSMKGTTLFAGDYPLIFFHFAHLKKVSRQTFKANLRFYEIPMGRLLRNKIYYPYLKGLLRIDEAFMPNQKACDLRNHIRPPILPVRYKQMLSSWFSGKSLQKNDDSANNSFLKAVLDLFKFILSTAIDIYNFDFIYLKNSLKVKT
ncbi:MAG: hypothetical protein HQM10_17650 [Candidatus Riflebacteria bacterium]|nr:hypothetical protein [Candidatus Riflebacteria bacterium]